MTARSVGTSGAETVISGEISTYATWMEDIYFWTPEGAPMDISGLDFEMQFRCSPKETSANITLSTSNTLLSIEEDAGLVDSILRIDVPAGTFSGHNGDMICDLVGIDSNNNIIHYGHGVVSFRNDPVAI